MPKTALSPIGEQAAAEPEIIKDPVESAKAAGLRYVTDTGPGITRKREGDHFTYFDPKGNQIEDPEKLKRINALAIPPAYTDVWICPNPNGHLQATARDARCRKQYRYHTKWREVRDETKYGRMIAFGQTLPIIRERVDKDLTLHGMPRKKVLATIVRLLETTMIRIGNEEYAKENRSYGLTTLRNKHVDVSGSTLQFHFQGKSGKVHTIGLKDRRLAQIVKRCQDIPGSELFEYLDHDGTRHTVDSADVNDYLREISGQDFTAKDFRTWAGTVLAALALKEMQTFDSAAEAKKNIVQAIETVSKRLGNTPSVCRKCYVHPGVIESYMDGALLAVLGQRAEQELAETLHSLKPEEAAVMALLQQRLTHPQDAQG
ncbi:MAG: DNA topoisomerase IB [Armatimonadota bacterium]|nr:DNA topoisomerase IB [Armatimonadota bacterium]